MSLVLLLTAALANPCPTREVPDQAARQASTAAVAGSVTGLAGKVSGHQAVEEVGGQVELTSLEVATAAHLTRAAAAVDCEDSPVEELGSAMVTGSRVAQLRGQGGPAATAVGAVGAGLVVTERVEDHLRKKEQAERGPRERPVVEIDLAALPD